MRAEVPVALLPAHRRRVERRQQRRRRRRNGRRLEVVPEHVASRAAEVDLRVRHRGERGARLPQRPTGPPAHVALGGRPERREPAAQQLRLRRRDRQLLDRPAEPVLGRHPAELRADPGPARPAAHEATLHRHLRQHARAGALLDHPLAGAEAELLRQQRHVRGHLGRHRLAARGDCGNGRVPRARDPRARPRRNAAVADEALEPLPLRRRDCPRGAREDHRDELERDGPERAPHREHPHDAPVLVQRSLDVGGRDAVAARADRQEDRDRVGRVQADERAGDRERIGCTRRRVEPVAHDQPRAPLGDVDPLHLPLLPT